MTALAGESHPEAVAGSHAVAAFDGQLAGLQTVGGDVNGDGPLRFGIFQASGGDHIPGAGEPFFVGLEHENGKAG